MRKLREVLRLSYSAGLSIRKISAAVPKPLKTGRAAKNNLGGYRKLGMIKP